jgi:hypothetical protein
MIWPHGLESAQEFCYHINSLMPTFKITMEIENDSTNPLSGELVIREGTTTNTKIYRKPIHTGPYLHFQSSRPPHVKRGIVKTIPRHIPRATGPVRRDCYFKSLTIAQCLSHWVSAINKPKRNVLRKEVQSLGFISVPYIRGVS